MKQLSKMQLCLFQTDYKAVMEFTRTPPHHSLRSDSPLQRKIRQLQQASDAQSRQVRQLLLQETDIISHRSPKKKSITPSPTASYQWPKPQTARVRYHYEDFLEQQQLKQAQASQRAVRKYKEELSIRGPMQAESFQNRQLDQQMQYLKSEEYRKYLETLAQGHSPRTRTPHNDKRTHQAYYRQKNRQIQMKIRGYQHSPRRTPNNSFYRQSFSPKNGFVRNEARFNNFTRRSPSRQIVKSQRCIKVQFQNYEPYKAPQTPRDLLKQHSFKETRNLSPQIVQEQEHSPPSLHKQIKYQCKNPSPLPAKRQQLRNAPAFGNTGKQPILMKQTRIQTYRKQLQFCNRQLQKPNKDKCKKNERSHKYQYGFKMSYNKENIQQKAASSLSSSPDKSPFKIQFKIDRQTYNKSYNAPPTSRQTKPVNNSKPYNYGYKHTKKQSENPYIPKLVTEPTYFERALQQSQTNSTATRTDNTKRSRKISVISRSKIK